MAAKQEVVGHVDHVELVLTVKPPQSVEYLHLNQRLMMKPDQIIITVISDTTTKMTGAPAAAKEEYLRIALDL